nr:ATP-dependent permease [Cryptococcus depauperatus CBS 7855]
MGSYPLLVLTLLSFSATSALSRSHSSAQVPELANTRSSISDQDDYSLMPPRQRPGNPGDRPDNCPPCFNCLLPAFSCGNSGECNPYDGQCRCPPGFGGQDCLTPRKFCGGLSDGDERYPRPDGEVCECKDGWGGINCNVCNIDHVCASFSSQMDAPVENSGDGSGSDMVCYKGGLAVERNFQVCDVTNRKIIDTIPDNKLPQVTFSCQSHPFINSTFSSSSLFLFNQPNLDDPVPVEQGTCNFQFWVDSIESFHCELDNCEWDLKGGAESQVNYKCQSILCSCIPGRFLCGENGSVNIDDFLAEEVKGPGSFSCQPGNGCSFEEPAMNQLINDIFGDKSITLNCESGECLHYSMVPGYVPPESGSNGEGGWMAVSALLTGIILLLACLLLWYLSKATRQSSGFVGVHLPEEEAAKLMSDHVPATLHFSNINYSLASGSRLLSHVTGTVRPGELLAIMGASGAGKSTLLDILARKQKKGAVAGKMYLNGRTITDEKVFRRVVGYVDQEDTLLSTLTVYEAVLFSALLRLPKEMSYEAKVFRTLETMNELGILGIKDSRIGESGKRSISGGEKRRVSIACELVTGPSILFLDEPTSGLDSYNAYNVVSSLKELAQTFKRTVIFTIHQPQSNIVNLFDRLLLLAKGQVVYSGEMRKAQGHFENLGHVCPHGYNIADYLIDLTVETTGEHRQSRTKRINGNGGTSAERGDAEAGFGSISAPASGSQSLYEGNSDHSTNERDNIVGEIKHKAHRLLGAFVAPSHILSLTSATPTAEAIPRIPEKLASLVLASRASDDAKIVEAEISRIENGEDPDGRLGDGRDVEEETGLMKGYEGAGFGTQFKLLSGRAFKNLYRNPLLMATHYAVAVLAAFLCGFFFYQVTSDIPGFQNRLGLFLFILSLFGFSCLSSLGIFASERLLFMRERANGYYLPISYFLAKVLFDIIPLRVLPPFILGSIVYGLAGLNPSVSAFWKFLMTLVLFNLSASSVVLFLGVALNDLGVANLLGSLVMLYNLLFAGLLMNYDRVPNGLKWMLTTSFFHAGYEALLVNELRYLQLVERKFGLDIQVPSATILSSFGFHAQAFWWPDTTLLAIVFAVFTLLSYLVLEFWVKERR